MSSGRPDFHPTMLLEGKYGSNLIPVLVDALGQLYTIISGNSGGVPTPVLLDAAGRILAHLVGADGATIRDVAVDGSGNLIARIRGKDGAGDLQDVLLDTAGNLSALIRGDNSGTLKTIAVDANGIMKANLSAQDLAYLKVRPVYGNVQAVSTSIVTCPNSAETEIFAVSGKGATVGGSLDMSTGNTLSSVSLWRLYIDGVRILNSSLDTFYFHNWLRPGQSPLYALKYYNDFSKWFVGITPGITFESSLSIGLRNDTGADITIIPYVFYALVP
jgi:hypothetical protein